MRNFHLYSGCIIITATKFVLMHMSYFIVPYNSWFHCYECIAIVSFIIDINDFKVAQFIDL